jgi:hypothetical protein
MKFEILRDGGAADVGRCEAMTMPSYAGDLPPFRCVREGTVLRDSRSVCVAHSKTLAIRYFDDERFS